ncbi:limonene-1,2-epoxide hydrolase family protein [Mycobacterium sp. 1164985.4]|uniref:limonene-1,2-epoxide hydrolase family protein n=1 Tax=Mycobacterium sp. 1164985.4 TaxID=1834069 RepID=UPI0007FDB1D8|nr:limonene-1,2-epoxide hydrolase family protein [Mycobacterium sp. 1164985.4]OBK82496.1 hypothetical protein A5650_23230 [Mycobacterium sp. 1164985.4]
MSESAESVIRRYLAAMETSDADELASYYCDDAVFIDGPRGTHEGIDAIRTEMQSMAMLSNFRVEVKTLVANGRTVMTERVDIFGIQDKSFELEVVGVIELDDNNHIKRWRDYYDLRSIEERMAAAFAPPN